MIKNTVIDFTKPSDFSPDPLADVLRAGARELVSEFLAGHSTNSQISDVAMID
jgi:putative transposase